MLKAFVIAVVVGLALAAPQKQHAKSKPEEAKVAAVQQKNQNETWDKPSFCRTLDCPVYAVLDSNVDENWEFRAYQPAVWVSTEVNAIVDNVNEQLDIAFLRLFDYIDGENDRGEVIEMTAPVTTKVVPGEGPNCNSYFTMSFYLPYANQADPPKPLASDIYLQQVPGDNIYAEMFDGYAEVKDYIGKIIELSESIGQENHETSYYYMVGYDSPFNPFNRHNEAWLVAK